MISKDERKKRAARAALIRKERQSRSITQEKLASMSQYTLSYLQKIENAQCGSEHAIDHYLGILRTYEA